jgi:hypothetical protein
MSSFAKFVSKMTKNGKNAADLLGAAVTVVSVASELLDAAGPILERVDTDDLAEKGRAAARAAADGIGKAHGAVRGAAGGAAAGAAGAVGSIFAGLGGATEGIVRDLAEARSKKELERAIKEARQTVLENATTRITVADLQKAIEKSPTAGLGPISDMPGCFVITTYKMLIFNNDLTDYTGIFVGKASNVADGVRAAISRGGDPDVYADVKYRQNVHVYVYNCMPEQLDERYLALVQVFSDERLYGSSR